jgi:hypothetical protein
MFPGPRASTRSKAYQVLARAQELCQWRFKNIEYKLSEAFLELGRLSTQDRLSLDHKTALCMAHHARLGQESPLGCLPDDLLRKIIGMDNPL